MEVAKEKDCEVDRVGCMISSELLDTDIWIPVRPISDNTVDAILNRFLLVVQSKKQNDLSLWGEPFTVSVTTIKRTTLTAKKQIKGAGRKKITATLHHRIKDQCMIKVGFEWDISIIQINF